MDVRDIDEFMEDVDEYEVKEMDTVEDDRGAVRAVKVIMVKPIAGDEAELFVNAWLHRERSYDFGRPDEDVPAMQMGGAEWYEPEYNVSQQEADDEAVRRLHNLIGKGDINFRKVLNKSYEVDILWEA